jgi:hypothetical protein
MSTVLSHQPGQTATIVQQILNLDGYRADGYSFSGIGAPIIARIIYPNFMLAPNFPLIMTKLDTGLYSHSFTLPSGAAAVGLYIVDIYWYHPNTLSLQQEIVQINVTAPFGLYSITAGP